MEKLFNFEERKFSKVGKFLWKMSEKRSQIEHRMQSQT